MRRTFLYRSVQLLLASSLGSLALPLLANEYKEIEWDDLMPEGWKKKVILELTRMRRYGSLMDGDPRCTQYILGYRVGVRTGSRNDLDIGLCTCR